MSLPPDLLEASIRSLPAELDFYVDPLLAALSTNRRRRSLSEASIGALRSALSVNRRDLYETASYLLSDASSFDPAAVSLIAELSQGPKVSQRYNAILCLSPQTPFDLVVLVIEAALKDRSAKVRTKAADRMLELKLTKALPALRSALIPEAHAETRATMEFTLALLRDGYLVRSINDEYCSITRLGSRGISTEVVRHELLEIELNLSHARGGEHAKPAA
jgi:hypothetical protein